MVPKSIGGYHVQEVLGQGASGIVYRVQAPGDEEEYALKLLKGVSPEWSHRLRREFRSVERLRHPQVVRVVNRGEYKGRPYVLMELVPGPDLWTHLGWPPRQPLQRDRLGELRKRTLEILAALSYVHGRGVVHRDLKPGNVLVDPRQGARLTDFGLAGLVGELEAGGTPNYMAPEQLVGRGADPRSDLYSLGIMLWEVLAGELPWARMGLGYTRRLRQDPPPLKKIRPELPRSWTDLIRRLTRVDPHRRPPTAEDAALILRRGSRRGRESTGLLDPGLVGRDEFQQRLEELLRELPQGRGGLVVLTGPPGCGRSALAGWAAERARFADLSVKTVWCGSGKGGFFHPFLELLDPSSSHPEPPSPTADSAEIYGAWDELRASLRSSSGGPCLWILEDLHRLGTASRSLLSNVVERLILARPGDPEAAEQPTLLLATARSGEAWLEEQLDSWLEDDIAQRWELPELAEAALEELLTRALALSQPAPVLAAKLGEIARGQPGGVIRLLTGLIASGRLHRLEGSWRLIGSEGAEPRVLTELTPADLPGIELGQAPAPSGVGEELMAWLDLEPAGLPQDVLLGVARGDETELLDGLILLLRRGLAEEDPADPGRIRLVGGPEETSPRDELAGREDRRRHRRLAEALAAMEPPADPAVLAEHWDRSDQRRRALDFMTESARRSSVDFDNESSFEWLTRAIDLTAELIQVIPPAWLKELHLLSAGVGGERLSTLLGASEAVQQDRWLADMETRRGVLLYDRAVVAQRIGRSDLALEDLAESCQLRRESGDPDGEAAALQQIGQVRFFQRELDAAEAAFHQAQERLRETGDQVGEATVLNSLGAVHQVRGALDEALQAYRGALAIRRELEDDRGSGRCRNNIGGVLFQQGKPGDAREAFTAASEELARVGDDLGLAYARHNQGGASQALSEFEPAHRSLTQALILRRRLGDKKGIAATLKNLGDIALLTGRVQSALELLRESAVLIGYLGRSAHEAAIRASLAEILAWVGEEDEALQEIQRALQGLEGAAAAEPELRHGRVLLLLQRPGVAVQAFRRALEQTRGTTAVYAAAGLARALHAQGDAPELARVLASSPPIPAGPIWKLARVLDLEARGLALEQEEKRLILWQDAFDQAAGLELGPILWRLGRRLALLEPGRARRAERQRTQAAEKLRSPDHRKALTMSDRTNL